MYCKQLSLFLWKFSDVRELYAVYVHFIAQVFRQFINRPGFGKTYFFYWIFWAKNLIIFILCNSVPSLWSFKTPSMINQKRIWNLKYLARTERKGGIKLWQNLMDMCPFTFPFYVPHERLPHVYEVKKKHSANNIRKGLSIV